MEMQPRQPCVVVPTLLWNRATCNGFGARLEEAVATLYQISFFFAADSYPRRCRFPLLDPMRRPSNCPLKHKTRMWWLGHIHLVKCISNKHIAFRAELQPVDPGSLIGHVAHPRLQDLQLLASSTMQIVAARLVQCFATPTTSPAATTQPLKPTLDQAEQM